MPNDKIFLVRFSLLEVSLIDLSGCISINASVKCPKHINLTVMAFKRQTKDFGFYLCFDPGDMSEIALALFQTLGHGVPKLHHHALLALVREPIMCP